MGKKFDEEKMTKAEEYAFKKSRLRHPTFLQDFIEKEEKKVKKKPVRRIRRKNDVWLPQDIVDTEKISNDSILQKDMTKKIWG